MFSLPGKFVAGTELLAFPAAAIAPTAVVPTQICSWTNADPFAVELALSADVPSTTNFGTTTFPPINASPIVGAVNGATTYDPPNPGFFRVEYGASGKTKIRYIDLKPARLYLGYCDTVRVSAARWRGATGWPAVTWPSLFCSAAVGLAGGGVYDELVSTQMQRHASGAAINTVFPVPEGATHFELGVTPETAGALWLGTNPNLRLFADEMVLWQITNGILVPTYRRLKCQSTSSLTFDSGGSNLTSTLWSNVSFYLNS